jgi:hypothetical protein
MPFASDGDIGTRWKYVDFSNSRGWKSRIAGERSEQIAGA